MRNYIRTFLVIRLYHLDVQNSPRFGVSNFGHLVHRGGVHPRKPLHRGHHKPLSKGHNRQGVKPRKSVKTKVDSGKISEKEEGTDYNDYVTYPVDAQGIPYTPTHKPTINPTDNDIDMGPVGASTGLPFIDVSPIVPTLSEWAAWGACNATGSTVQLETNLRKVFTINYK